MRWLSASAAIFTLAPVAALAADLPPAPAPVCVPAAVQTVENWTGFYLGGNFGAGMARAQSDFSAAGVPFATADTNLWGPAGGAQLGYNWQTGATVFGAEADFQWSDLKGSISAQCAVCAEHDVNWFGTCAAASAMRPAAGWLM